MYFKNSVKNKSLVFWSILLLVFSSALMHTEIYFEDQLPGHEIPVPGIIRLNYNRAQILLKGDEGFKKIYSTIDNKWIKYRKKFKRLIDGDDDHEIYVKSIRYTTYIDRFLKINYETPYFLSQQHSFLFRLSVF